MNKTNVLLKAEQVQKAYQDGDQWINVLNQLDLTVSQGESVAIIGSSGSGKTTLLHSLGGLDKPDSGQICIDGLDLVSLSEKACARLRNRCLGFVYQYHHLLPEFTALENVMMPLWISGCVAKQEALDRSTALIKAVGLSERSRHRPYQLSGGERQRVAVARALANQPKLILADEPTGNLDKKNAEQLLDVLLTLNRTEGTALVIVTHDLVLARRLNRVYELSEGRLRCL